MTRFKDWLPHGVIPAVLLPFRADFSEQAARDRRKDLRDSRSSLGRRTSPRFGGAFLCARRSCCAGSRAL